MSLNKNILRGSLSFCFFSSPVHKGLSTQTVYQGDPVELDLHPDEDDQFSGEDEPQRTVVCTLPIVSTPVTTMAGGKKRKLVESMSIDGESEAMECSPLVFLETPVTTQEATGLSTSDYGTDLGEVSVQFDSAKVDKQRLIKELGLKSVQIEIFLKVCSKVEDSYPGGMWKWLCDNHFKTPLCELTGNSESGIVISSKGEDMLLDLKALAYKLALS